MAVSYNLDVKNFQSLDVLSQAIIGAPFSKGLPYNAVLYLISSLVPKNLSADLKIKEP